MLFLPNLYQLDFLSHKGVVSLFHPQVYLSLLFVLDFSGNANLFRIPHFLLTYPQMISKT